MKKICTKCKKEFKEEYCHECRKKSKRRTSFVLLILVFFILVFSFPLIENTGFYVNVNRDIFEDIPFMMIKEVNSSIPFERYVCQNISFRFTTSAGNVDSVRSSVRPNLIITNLENTWGLFKVNFSYIDESKFPYDIYGGKNLSESLRTGRISYRDADFYSENYEIFIGPSESVAVNNLTLKKDKTKQYWAIAYIEEPKKTECTKKTEYINKLENRTFTEFRKEKKTIVVSEYRRLNEILGLQGYSDWIILLILAFLIIFLLIRIKIKAEDLKNTKD